MSELKMRAEQAGFEKRKVKAAEYIKDPKMIAELVQSASSKMSQNLESTFKDLWGQMKTMNRLLKSYIDGTYSQVPTEALIMMVAAIIYFVSPIDAIPDFFAFIGYTDDAAVIGYVLREFKGVLDEYLEWEKAGGSLG